MGVFCNTSIGRGDLSGRSWVGRGLMTGRLDAPIIEVDERGITWHRSSRSHPTTEPKCAEVALDGAIVRVRDSKSPRSGELHLSHTVWRGLVHLLSATAATPER
jgi:hypothetical protein